MKINAALHRFQPAARDGTMKQIEVISIRAQPTYLAGTFGEQMNRAARSFLYLFPVVTASFGLSLFAASGAKLSSEAVTSADAGTIYKRDCASCHGRDGRGRTRKGRQTRARDLTDAPWQDDVSDERLFNSISNGRGKMPAFRKTVTENDIDALVAFIRRLRR